MTTDGALSEVQKCAMGLGGTDRLSFLENDLGAALPELATEQTHLFDGASCVGEPGIPR